MKNSTEKLLRSIINSDWTLFNKKPIPQKLNQESLQESIEVLNKYNINYCVTWGTQLGLTRDSALIDGDDDIDFLIDAKDFDKVVEAFYKEKYLFSPICPYAKFAWPDFLQVVKVRENVGCLVDFYFYHDESPFYVEGFYYEPWDTKEEKIKNKTSLRFPKEIFFPFIEMVINDVRINMPNKPELAAEWSFGKNWKKIIEIQAYKWEIVNHTPKITV